MPIRWKPFEEMNDLLEDLRFVPMVVGDLATDVYEDDNNVYIEMAISGIDPDKIDIDIENHWLKVSGSRYEEKEKTNKHFHKKEIRRGSFERIVTLPCAVDEKHSSAEYHDGILKIIFPKEKKGPGIKIKVKKK